MNKPNSWEIKESSNILDDLKAFKDLMRNANSFHANEYVFTTPVCPLKADNASDVDKVADAK